MERTGPERRLRGRRVRAMTKVGEGSIMRMFACIGEGG
jgi:hypothetical protein